MCGRFALTATADALQAFFEATELERHEPRFNIAPTQPIVMIRTNGDVIRRDGDNRPDRESLFVRWGLLPSWVKDPNDFPLLINARAETAAGKASFKAPMRHRRTLIPASGFYEWQRAGRNKPQAYWVRPRDGDIVAFAGLMDTWSSVDGSEIDTGAVLTIQANSAINHIHHRMPVVIRPEHFARWLDCKTQEPRDVADLLTPIDEDFFEAIPVSDKVNKAANIGPDLQDEVEIVPEPEKASPDVLRPSDQLTLF
ncbi:MAG: SOS response-associated peptidase [Alphaproteobacteria bacterium]|nr:SOS response-associated peptidase [Alphaproteobacteria bacterium]